MGIRGVFHCSALLRLTVCTSCLARVLGTFLGRARGCGWLSAQRVCVGTRASG